MHYEPWQWALGLIAAAVTGISKTGIPGVGVLIAPLLAAGFGGWLSVGMMPFIFLFGDFFAASWYRPHAQWDRIRMLLPSALVGMLIGVGTIFLFGKIGGNKDILGKMIGVLVVILLALYFAQERFGIEPFTPKSRLGGMMVGAALGFAGTVSSGAGPIMSIYLSALKTPKDNFMGTVAWLSFLINASKLPVLIALSIMSPEKPILSMHSLTVSGLLCPLVVVGLLVGRSVLSNIPQSLFDKLVLGLAALSAIRLLGLL